MAAPPPPQLDWRTQRRILRQQQQLERQRLRSLRRSSVAGPLLLLGIGILFLLLETGRLSHLQTFLAFARFWPLLFVAVGVVRLVEWLVDARARSLAAAQGRPYASRSLGGGVIALLILVALAGILASAARENVAHVFGHDLRISPENLEQFFGNKHESDRSLSYACPNGTLLTVQNPHGDVIINGTSTDGQLHLDAHETVYSSSDQEAAQRTDRLTPHIDQSADSITLSLPAVEGSRSDLTLSVPPGTTVVASANHGDVHVHSLQAPLTVTANHGDVELSSLNGPVSGHINNGESSFSAHNLTGPLTIEGRGLDLTLSDLTGLVTLNGEFFGTVHIERSHGPVHLHTSRVDLQFRALEGELEVSEDADLSADQITGPLVLNTRNRNITLERVSGDVSLTNRNGSVSLTAAAPLGSINVENRNGSIDLSLPSSAGFRLDAETVNADLTNDFGLRTTQDGNRTAVTGTVGGGGPLIHLSTSQAELNVRRSGSSSTPHLPSTPPSPSATGSPSSPPAPPLTPRPSGSDGPAPPSTNID